MFAEQDGICAWPDCPDLADELDHVHGWQAGDHRDNVQGLCTRHHREKTEQEARDAKQPPD